MKLLTKIQSKRPQRAEAQPVPSGAEIVFPRVVPLTVDHRHATTPEQDRIHRAIGKAIASDHRPAPDAPPQLGVTPDNFEQILADVLADMNADDEAAAVATTQKDDSF